MLLKVDAITPSQGYLGIVDDFCLLLTMVVARLLIVMFQIVVLMTAVGE